MMNETNSVQGIDVCSSKDWQSRGPTEILLKTFAIYFTSAVLLSQYGARCKMPMKERSWFVARALLFPLWSATALILNIIARVATSIPVFDESGGPLRAVCAAIGMYAKKRKDEALPQAESPGVPGYALPGRVPMAEINNFTDATYANDTRPLRAQRSKPKKHWRKRSLSLLIIVIYILQAATTLLLMFRRSQFTQKTYTAHGKIMLLDDRDYRWWESRPGFNDGFSGGFKKSVAFTPADSGATKLAIYGILVALSYIVVESTGMRWEFVDTKGPWKYRVEGTEWRAQRCCIGICVSYLTDYGLHRLFGTLSTYRRTWAMLSEVLKLGSVSERATGNVPFLVIGALILLILRNFKPLRIRMPLWVRSRYRIYFSPFYLPLALLDSFDFMHQDPSELRFLECDLDTTSLKPGEEDDWVEDARHRQIRYYLYVSAWAIPLIVFGTLSLYVDFWTSRPLWERWVMDDGCVVRGDLNAWAWKDPLADMLWAF